MSTTQTTITLPWGMILMGRRPRAWWVGVAPGGRHLVVERVHEAPGRRYRRRVVELPRTRHAQDLAAEHEALETLAATLTQAGITPAEHESLEVLLLGVCAERGIGERGTRVSARRDCPPPWTITVDDLPRLPIVPGEIRALSPAVIPLWGTDGTAKRAKTPRLKGSWLGGRAVPAGTSAYGIDCAWSEVLVVDLDRHAEGVDGVESWRSWLSECDLRPPRTLEVLTPSGGRHLYYRQDGAGHAPIGSAVGVLPGVDLRGGHVDIDGKAHGGGYVVGPGSQVGMADGSVGTYRVAVDAPVAPLPDDLAEALAELVSKGKPKRRTGEAARPVPAVDLEHLDTHRWDRLRRMEDTILTCEPGTRHDAINRAVFGAVMAGCPPEAVRGIALEAIRQAGIVDHERDVETAIEDALQARENEGDAR